MVKYLVCGLIISVVSTLGCNLSADEISLAFERDKDSDGYADRWVPSRSSLEVEAAVLDVDGKRCQKIGASNYLDGLRLHWRYRIKITPDKTYTVSVNYKSGGAILMRFSLEEWEKKSQAEEYEEKYGNKWLRRNITLRESAEWNIHEATVHFPAGVKKVNIYVQNGEKRPNAFFLHQINLKDGE